MAKIDYEAVRSNTDEARRSKLVTSEKKKKQSGRALHSWLCKLSEIDHRRGAARPMKSTQKCSHEKTLRSSQILTKEIKNQRTDCRKHECYYLIFTFLNHTENWHFANKSAIRTAEERVIKRLDLFQQ